MREDRYWRLEDLHDEERDHVMYWVWYSVFNIVFGKLAMYLFIVGS